MSISSSVTFAFVRSILKTLCRKISSNCLVSKRGETRNMPRLSSARKNTFFLAEEEYFHLTAGLLMGDPYPYIKRGCYMDVSP